MAIICQHALHQLSKAMVLVVLVVDLVTVAVVVLSVQVGLVAGIILNLLFLTGA